MSGWTGSSWSNWAGNVVAHPVRVATPRDAGEIQQVMREANAQGLAVRAVGSGHSFSPVAATDGVLVDLHQLSGIVQADTTTGLVRVRAGTGLRALNEALWALGLAMPNLGDIDKQTIAGAIATGTHGTGARFGGLATTVRAMQLVLPGGDLVECVPGEDLFEAAVISRGELGIVTELTLQTVPAFLLHAAEAPERLDQVLESFDALADGIDHFELYWFPHTDRVLTKRNTRLPLDAGAKPLPRWRAWLDDELLSNTVFEGVNRLCALRPQLTPRVNAVSARALSAREFTDRSYRVYASVRDVRFVEMEVAIARPDLVPTLRELQRAVDASEWRIPFPVEVRVAAADDLWLSTATGRDSAYIAIHQYHRDLPYQEYFDTFARIADAVGGRPHWGKVNDVPVERLRELYPRYADWERVRDAVRV